MIESMAALTAERWDREMNRIQFEPTYKIRIAIIADRFGPAVEVKHVAWALVRLFDIIVDDDRYSIGTFVIDLGWSTGVLALGSINIVDSSVVLVDTADLLPGNLSSSALKSSIPKATTNGSNDLTPGPESSLIDNKHANLKAIQSSTLNQTSDYVPDLSTSNDVAWHLLYRPHGAIFHDVQVYNASLKLLLRIAEVGDQSATIWPMIATYNDKDDFTLSVRPVGFAKSSELSWAATANLLGYLAEDISRRGKQPGRWAELGGSVEVDGKFVGIVCIDKYDRMGRGAEDLCQVPAPGGVYDYGAVSSA